MQPTSTTGATGALQSESIELGVELAEALGTITSTDPTLLDPPLNDAIDVDALETLFESLDDEAVVTFDYQDHTVEVAGDGTIAIDGIVY